MKKRSAACGRVYFLGVLLILSGIVCRGENMSERIKLPEPRTDDDMSVAKAIQQRRSVRSFASKPLELEQVGQILWAAQGITGPDGRKRAAPSAGATYPLDIYVAVGEDGVGDLDAGVYRYVPGEHLLERTYDGDVRNDIAAAALNQRFLAAAPVNFLTTCDYDRTTRRYGRRGIRYVHMEAGHAAQNICLQAVSLGLGTVAVGAFSDEDIAGIFGLDETDPLYLLPVGYPSE